MLLFVRVEEDSMSDLDRSDLIALLSFKTNSKKGYFCFVLGENYGGSISEKCMKRRETNHKKKSTSDFN